MRFSAIRKKNLMVEIISALFIILFVYAAVIKLRDFEQFRAELGQSPLFNAFADFVTWGVPMVEIFIALLFFSKQLRLFGLWASLSVMVIFSTYIIFVLNFADSIPCSCGGVIASLSWNEHLIFNIGLMILTIIGISLIQKPLKNKRIGATSLSGS